MHVWVIEFWTGKKWVSTTGCEVFKDLGRLVLKDWKQKFPNTKYRLKKYIPVPIDDRPVGHLKPF